MRENLGPVSATDRQTRAYGRAYHRVIFDEPEGEICNFVAIGKCLLGVLSALTYKFTFELRYTLGNRGLAPTLSIRQAEQKRTELL